MVEPDITYQFNGPLKGFLSAITQQKLLPEHAPLFSSKNYKDGCVLVQVFDHRDAAGRIIPTPAENGANVVLSPVAKQTEIPLTVPQISSLVLRPTSGTIQADVSCMLVNENMAVNEKSVLDAESRLLTIMSGPLDLNPSLDNLRKENLKSFNELKYNIKRKRRKDWMEKEKEEASRMESNRLLLLMDSTNKNFHPKFSKLAFLEEWNRKKAIADSEQLIGVESKTGKGSNYSFETVLKNVQENKVQHICCVITIENVSVHYDLKEILPEGKVYTILNVNETQDSSSEYEAVLRWGNAEGLPTGGGKTIRYPLGNLAAAEYYIAHFKGFYGLTNSLISDVSTIRVPQGPVISASSSNAPTLPTRNNASPNPNASAAGSTTPIPQGTPLLGNSTLSSAKQPTSSLNSSNPNMAQSSPMMKPGQPLNYQQPQTMTATATSSAATPNNPNMNAQQILQNLNQTIQQQLLNSQNSQGKTALTPQQLMQINTLAANGGLFANQAALAAVAAANRGLNLNGNHAAIAAFTQQLQQQKQAAAAAAQQQQQRNNNTSNNRGKKN